jgi:hypothetical protein
MIRSPVANIVLLVFGISLLAFAVVIVVGYLLASTPRPFPIGPLVFFTTLGVWCTVGAVINLRGHAPLSKAGPPLRTSTLLEWNIALIVSSVAGSILFVVFGGGDPAPGLLQRSVGIVMVISVLTAPIVIGAHIVERIRRSRRSAQ